MPSQTSITPTSLPGLFDGAASAGLLGPGSRSLLSGDLGAVVVAGAAGADLEDIMACDVTLVTVLIDSSSSIGCGGLEQAVRDGQNALLDAFAASSAADDILVALWTFNDNRRVVHSYVPVGDAKRLDQHSYRASGGTALYDAWCDALAANVAYAQTLRDGGTPCRSVVVVVTDGEDVCSKRKVGDCRKLSADLLKSEQFVLAFVGVGSEADFRRVAKRMGVPDDCVLVSAQATPKAIRQAFHMVSQSTIRASQGLVRPGLQAGFFGP
ncbi:MAG: VWA domain-containing protein [Alphaproteobacteria bacterium]|nr:VWA domain-containing protein [Alphaproteobacteria bacterium]